ncbi:hypothetical protein FAZ15_02905 [Sphingobacterium olei]|uniref:Lipoprotein n=1 Tax=Sphingobacterium olei TaxID=2571155 RepID=A0A4U0P701_9SPHI|nr:hypothetical protein [Sphingobacterium olei]TJZ63255.1 hypothetical protein FAZ15_02905 [Sphingobacterium olei]
MKTWSKHIGFVILLCLGFFLTPSTGYACAKKAANTEQKSCSKDQSAKAEKKDCCETKSCKKDKNHDDCNGKCKNSSCRCNISSSFVSSTISSDFKVTDYFAETKKQKFGFKQAYYSSGYPSIWQPPKIS